MRKKTSNVMVFAGSSTNIDWYPNASSIFGTQANRPLAESGHARCVIGELMSRFDARCDAPMALKAHGNAKHKQCKNQKRKDNPLGDPQLERRGFLCNERRHARGLTYQGNRRPAAGAKRRRRGVRVDREVRRPIHHGDGVEMHCAGPPNSPVSRQQPVVRPLQPIE